MTSPTDITIWDRLAEPFDPSLVKWRVGADNGKKQNGRVVKEATKGIALAYADARVYMDRYDEVLGPDRWQSRFEEVRGTVCCSIGVMVRGAMFTSVPIAPVTTSLGTTTKTADPEWVWKSDGAGPTDFEGEKGQYSDAFKRASVHWGVGRYLYSIDSPWVVLENGRRIAKSEDKALFDALMKASNAHQWGGPNDATAYRLLRSSLEELARLGGDIASFIEAHQSIISQFRVGYKREFGNLTNRLISKQKEAA